MNHRALKFYTPGRGLMYQTGAATDLVADSDTLPFDGLERSFDTLKDFVASFG